MIRNILLWLAIFSVSLTEAIEINPSKERLKPERPHRPYLFQGDPRRMERANTVQLRDVILELDLSTYSAKKGSQVGVNLSVYNRSRRPIVFLFPNSQRLEVMVVNEFDNEVFLLSSHKEYNNTKGATVINPRERAIFSDVIRVSGWSGGMPAGRYKVIATVAGYPELQLSASLVVE